MMTKEKRLHLNWVTGTSGVGKTYIFHYLKEHHPSIICFDIDLFYGPNYDLRKENMLRLAQDISEASCRYIIFGTITYEQLSACRLFKVFDHLTITALTLKDESTLRSRLTERSWKPDIIQRYVDLNTTFRSANTWEGCDYTSLDVDEMTTEALADYVIAKTSFA